MVSINGNTRVFSITLSDREEDEQKEIEVSGAFIYTGFIPNSDFGRDVLQLDEKGYIVTDEKMETSVPGIFSAGDIRADRVRQISTACGSAVTAVVNAESYVREQQSA